MTTDLDLIPKNRQYLVRSHVQAKKEALTHLRRMESFLDIEAETTVQVWSAKSGI